MLGYCCARVKRGEESRPGAELALGTQLMKHSGFKVTAGLHSGERPQGTCPMGGGRLRAFWLLRADNQLKGHKRKRLLGELRSASWVFREVELRPKN